MKVLPLFLLFLFSCAHPTTRTVATGDTPEKADAYHRLIAKYDETEALEQKVFDRLIFTPSDTQLNKSINFKFVARDQLGRDWHFKAGPNSGVDGAVAVYRAYKMFGLNTPEIHSKTFQVNDHKVTGSLQRLVPNIGNIGNGYIDWPSFPPSALQYMAKNHVMSWLLLNHQVYPDQFLVTSQDGKTPNEIIRIDNAVDWPLLGQDSLAFNYQTPMLWRANSVGYVEFWREYFSKNAASSKYAKKMIPTLDTWIQERLYTFDLDLKKTYDWARFISDFPDATYENFFEAGIENQFKYFSQLSIRTLWIMIPEVMLRADPDQFLTQLVERKHTLPEDLARVYQELASLRGEEFQPSKTVDYRAIADEIIANLDVRTAQLKADLAQIDLISSSKIQKPIEIPSSYPTYLALMDLSHTKFLPSLGDRIAYCYKTLKQLEAVKKDAVHPMEKKAVTTAIDNIRELVRRSEEVLKERGDPHSFAVWTPVMHPNLFFQPGFVAGSIKAFGLDHH